MGCDLIRIKTDSNNNYNSLCSSPSCGEQAGENFKGSGNKQTTFNWFKCGRRKLL